MHTAYIVIMLLLPVIWMMLGLQGSEGRLTACAESTSPGLCHKGDHYSVSDYPSEPTIVNTTLWIKDISEINVERQAITMFLEVAIEWLDERINFNQRDGNITK